jgi:EAL domain-containing protein (putative c-di-GMP-specific phosphodiesterase class I)
MNFACSTSQYYELRSQRIEGLEALIRWRSPTRGEIHAGGISCRLPKSTSLDHTDRQLGDRMQV